MYYRLELLVTAIQFIKRGQNKSSNLHQSKDLMGSLFVVLILMRQYISSLQLPLYQLQFPFSP